MMDNLDFENLDLFGEENKKERVAFEVSRPPHTEGELRRRYVIPPFSVLDARQGYWQARKRAWLALGIQSELGRGGGC